MVFSIGSGPETMLPEAVPRRERRSGMAYVFEGISPQILERLGWTEQESEDEEEKMENTPEDTLLSEIMKDDDPFVEELKHTKSSKSCERQLSVNQFYRYSIVRHRRNAVADLFSELSLTQKQALSEICAKFEA